MITASWMTILLNILHLHHFGLSHMTHASVLDAGTVCDEAVLVSLCVGRKGEPFCQQSPALPPYVVALHRAF